MVDVTKRTRRRRKERLSIDDQEIASRVMEFYDDTYQANAQDREQRLQRYAKFRGWVEGKDWPWEEASDVPLSDIMEKSLRMQDTLHNAVLSQRPAISAQASNRADNEKQAKIDNLIDFQLFVEQPGEHIVGDLAENFVNDGVFTAFIPWIKERREIVDQRFFSPIPDNELPQLYFQAQLRMIFPGETTVITPKDSGWDFGVKINENGVDQEFEAKFYTEDDGRVHLFMDREVETYNGPRVIPYDYDQVLHPTRVANLQIPGPNNPGGSPWVILVDHPTIDEIERLARSKFYDRMDSDDIDGLAALAPDRTYEDRQQQLDDLEGKTDDPIKKQTAPSHTRLTRLLCFDIFDIDDDGRQEDVIWWVLLESKKLMKAKRLTDMYPSQPPRRPLAEASFLPVPGRRVGISLPELVEGTHDVMKTVLDQTIDSGAVAISPFFFYRPQSSIKPEIIELSPGSGYPLANPQQDVQFPQLGNTQALGFGLNVMTLLNQMEERLTTISDYQFGRVPAGKSSALRTIGGMQLLAGQAEARPERILRRFFNGLVEVYTQIHELNQHFLPRDKQFRIIGVNGPSDDPYQEIKDRDLIRGRFQFTFSANVLNTSKAAMQESLQAIMQVLLTPIAVQLGIVDPNGVYLLLRDFIRSLGQDPDRYANEPAGSEAGPEIFVEEALQQIMNNEVPAGRAAEPGGAIEHMKRLIEFMNGPNFAFLSPMQVDMFKQYLARVLQQARAQAQRMKLAQAAAEQQAGQQAQNGGRPPAGAPQQDVNNPPQISGGNEMIDESLPTAGGGANKQTMQ